MTISWVMRTLDRSPRKNYLGATLTRLAESGKAPLGALPIIVVNSAPAADDATERWLTEQAPDVVVLNYVHADRKYTNNENAVRALQAGLNAGADWIVHLEDDLDVCDDFFGSVERWLQDHVQIPAHLYTFHCPYKGVQRALEGGLTYYHYPVKDFYGNQCWAMRRADAESLVTFLEDRIPTWGSPQGFDMLIKEWATAQGAEYFLASAPSFVQHVGSESSLHFGRFHQNASWPGRGWRYIGSGAR